MKLNEPIILIHLADGTDSGMSACGVELRHDSSERYKNVPRVLCRGCAMIVGAGKMVLRGKLARPAEGIEDE